MSEMDSIIAIQLTRSSTPVAVASFSIPLVLSSFTNFSDRVRSYGSLSAVAGDFKSTDFPYIMAAQLFGQSTVGATPASILIGRRQVDAVTGAVTVANSTVYTLTINSVAYNFTSSSSATAINIVAGLKTASTAATGITFLDNLDGTFKISVTVAGTAWSITSSTNVSLTVFTPTEAYADALTAINAVNSTWYCLICSSHLQADVVALNSAVTGLKKIYGTSLADITAIATTTTDTAAVLSALSAGRTFGVYLPTADAQYPEAAWVGAQLPYTPGSNDWDFKQAVNVTVGNISDTARVNLRTKKCNMYTTLGGVTVFQDGNMFDGSPIDQVIGQDWLYANLQQNIFFRLINSLKIPMTNPGLVVIENEIRSTLSQAQANGLIDSGWSVITPDVLSIPVNMRALRTAGVFQFNCRLAGSVRIANIVGYLAV
jgi:hypothetical protein